MYRQSDRTIEVKSENKFAATKLQNHEFEIFGCIKATNGKETDETERIDAKKEGK